MGVTVGQLLNYKGSTDFFKPLTTCGDGVVSKAINETCDALFSQHPYASGCPVVIISVLVAVGRPLVALVAMDKNTSSKSVVDTTAKSCDKHLACGMLQCNTG